MFRIRSPERKNVIKPVGLIKTQECQTQVFFSRRVRLEANEAAFVNLRKKNYNELSDIKQICVVSNTNSQIAVILGRSI